MKTKFILLIIFVVTISFFYGSEYLNAFTCTSTPGYVLVNGVCLPDPTHAQGPKGLSTDDKLSTVIVKVISFILGFLGGIATLMILVSGVIYITAESDENRVDMAKRMLTTAIYGLILALLAYAIVHIISKALGVI